MPSFDDLQTTFEQTNRQTVPVTVNGTKYVMVEYGGNELAEDQQEKFGGLMLDAKGQPSMIQTNMDPVSVVARCLHHTKDGHAPTTKVPRMVIGAWAAGTVKGLENIAKRLNGEGKDEAKKDSAPETTSPGTESPNSSAAPSPG